MTQAPDHVTRSPDGPTPILDSAVLPPLPRRKKLGIAIGLVVGLAVGMWLGHDYKNLEPGHHEFFAIAVVFVLPVIVHELGHLFAGWLVGFRFSSFGVGPLLVAMEHGRLKIRVRTGTAHAGYVAMQTGAICRLRRRFLIFVIGGPAANLLSLPLTALLVNHVFPGWSHSWLAIPAGQFAAISLAIGIGSLLPFGDGSDGQRIAILFRSPVATRRLLTCLALGSQVRKGIRPKLWKHTWLDTASRLRDGAKDEFFGKWLAYVSANDAKDADLAAFYLERCLELARGRGSKLLDIAIREATVFTAWFWQDANLAEKWLAQMKRPGQVSPLVKTRVDVALLSARREFEPALARWGEGLAFIQKMPPSPNQTMLLEGWVEWKSDIQERQQQAVA